MIRPGVIKNINHKFIKKYNLVTSENKEIKIMFHGVFQATYENNKATKKENFPLFVLEIAQTGQIVQGEIGADFQLELNPLVAEQPPQQEQQQDQEPQSRVEHYTNEQY